MDLLQKFPDDAQPETLDKLSKPEVAPILASPSEIIGAIFEEYIAEDSRRIGDILFVCRRWYAVCMESLYLWTYIRWIIKREISEDVRTLASSVAFLSTCIERSVLSLLRIIVHLQRLQQGCGLDTVRNGHQTSRIV